MRWRPAPDPAGSLKCSPDLPGGLRWRKGNEKRGEGTWEKGGVKRMGGTEVGRGKGGEGAERERKGSRGKREGDGCDPL